MGPFFRAVASVLALCVLTSCGGNEERAGSSPPPNAQLFAQPPTLAPAAPTPVLSPVAHEPLPRKVADVALGMPHSEVEHILGQLDCSQRAVGYEVCTGQKDTGQDVSSLEVFFYHGLVFSLSYAAPNPPDAWSYLNSVVTTYGEPSLKGLAQQDSKGRLHEIYGWKDDATIYSVRFIWVEEAPNPRQLSSVAITLWDRAAYFDWEKDPARLQTTPVEPTPTSGEQPGHPTPEMT
jgi:hypothetical protein